jgi:hypothetical protein
MPKSKKSKHTDNNFDNNDSIDSDMMKEMKEINQQLTEADEYIAKTQSGNDTLLDSSDVPDMMTDDMLSEFNNDKISIDEETAKKLDEEAKKSFVENDVYDAVVQFMKTDDMISKKETELREEIAPLKKHRTGLETFLIDYLEQIDQEFIKIGEKTQLTKVETVTKSAIKPANVADALVEGFKKHELYTEDQVDEMTRVIKDMMLIVESKREQKITKKIARIDLDKKAKKDAKKASKINTDKIKKTVKDKKPKKTVKDKKPKKTVKVTKTKK